MAEAPALSPLELDRLFQEGDENTWDLEDWNWDPYQLFAEPKGGASCTGCQAFKRRKGTDGATVATGAQGQNDLAIDRQASPLSGDTALDMSNLSATSAGPQPQQLHPGQPQAGAMPPPWATVYPGAPSYTVPLPAQPLLNPLQHMPQCHVDLSHYPQHPYYMNMQQAAQVMVPPHMHGAIGITPTTVPPVNMTPPRMWPYPMPNAVPPGPVALNQPMATLGPQNVGTAAAVERTLQRHPPLVSEKRAAGQGQQSAVPIVQESAVAPAAPSTHPTTPAAPASAPPPAQVASTDSQKRGDGTEAEGSVSLSDPGPLGETEKLICQVPGCGKLLDGLKDYHQRYRICEVHIKLPQVMKDGRLQRFCQQCGRFHDLSAFDGNRKSCRDQLSKHNARRRRRTQLEQTMAMAESFSLAAEDKSEVGKLLQSLLSNPFQLHALRLLLGVQTHPALPSANPYPAEHAEVMAEAAAGLVDGDTSDQEAPPSPAVPCSSHMTPTQASSPMAQVPVPSSSAIPVAPPMSTTPPPQLPCVASAPNMARQEDRPTYNIARAMVDGSAPFHPNFESDSRVLRWSMKLFNCTPADLPPDLQQQMAGWLEKMPGGLEGYIRPGCVLLTLQAYVSEDVYVRAKSHGLDTMLGSLMSPYSHPFWHRCVAMIQMFDQIVMLSRGQVVAREYTGQHRQSTGLPHLDSRSCPPVTLLDKSGSVNFQLRGSHLNCPDCTVLVRSQGKYLPCTTRPAGRRFEDDLIDVHIQLPAGAGTRLLFIEVARGAYLSPARPLLVVESLELVREVLSLKDSTCLLGKSRTLSNRQRDALLVDLALVLQHVEGRAGIHMHPRNMPSKARHLLAFACDMGWIAVAQRVLPLASATCACAADIVSAIHECTGDAGCTGLSLLHRAVRSGSLEMVSGILEWGRQQGYKWSVSHGGPGGVSPLHLAALLEDDEASILLALLDEAGSDAFTSSCAADGVTPFHLAFQMGQFCIDRLLPAIITKIVEHKMPGRPELIRPSLNSTRAMSRTTNQLDSCVYCQSPLPPLLLSIMAYCSSCGARKRFGDWRREQLKHAAPVDASSTLASEAAGDSRSCNQGANHSSKAAQAAPKRRRGVDIRWSDLPLKSFLRPEVDTANNMAGMPEDVASGDLSCSHNCTATVYSITALCQTCHANRSMEVA